MFDTCKDLVQSALDGYNAGTLGPFFPEKHEADR